MSKARTFTPRGVAMIAIGCMLGAAAVIATPAAATVVSITNSIYGEVDDDFGFRTFTFDTDDFSGSNIVTGVTIALDFSKCYRAGVTPEGCVLGTSGLSYPYEIGFALGSPAGTRVALVENDGGNEAWESGDFATYEFGSYQSFPHIEILFADSGKPLGKYPSDGTFAPEDSLSSFIGQSAVGTWTLFFEDDYLLSPLGLHEATLNIEVASVAAVSAPDSLMLLGIGLLGLFGLRHARRLKAV